MRGSFFRDRALELKRSQKRLRGPKPKVRFVEAVGVKSHATEVQHDYTNIRQQLRRAFPNIWGARRAVCKKCRIELVDVEPAARHPEYWHPKKDNCAFSGRRLDVSDSVPFARKKYRRARARGARLASKFRPR